MIKSIIFQGTLSKYSTGTLGIFVTTVGYTKSSFEEAENSDYDIILTDLSNLIKKFTSYINKRTKRRSSNDDNEFITVESAEFENIEVEEDATLSIFGIEIKGKVSLSNIKFNNVSIKRRKLDN